MVNTLQIYILTPILATFSSQGRSEHQTDMPEVCFSSSFCECRIHMLHASLYERVYKIALVCHFTQLTILYRKLGSSFGWFSSDNLKDQRSFFPALEGGLDLLTGSLYALDSGGEILRACY